MPCYKTHIWGGLGSAAILCCIAPLPALTLTRIVEWGMCAVAGALFPDIDTKSKGQKYFYRGMLIVLLLLAYQKEHATITIMSIIACVPLVVVHRGLLHRAWFVVGSPLLAYYLFTATTGTFSYRLFIDILFFICGALSHLWLDLGFRRMWRW